MLVTRFNYHTFLQVFTKCLYSGNYLPGTISSSRPPSEQILGTISHTHKYQL